MAPQTTKTWQKLRLYLDFWNVSVREMVVEVNESHSKTFYLLNLLKHCGNKLCGTARQRYTEARPRTCWYRVLSLLQYFSCT